MFAKLITTALLISQLLSQAFFAHDKQIQSADALVCESLPTIAQVISVECKEGTNNV